MPKQIITSATAPVTGFTDKATPSPLAQAIRFGNMLFVSGQGPLDPQTKEVVSADIQEQTRQTLRNIEGVLKAAGASFANVVNMRVCLRDTADFPKFNEAFAEFLKGEKVTRTCIGGTPHRKGVNVEIDCVAMEECEGDLEKKRQEAMQVILAQIEQYAGYHRQKENMTWAATTIFIGGSAYLLVSDPFWKDWSCYGVTAFLVILLFTAIMLCKFLKDQFKNRKIGSQYVHALTNVAVRWATSPASLEDISYQELPEDDFKPSGQLGFSVVVKEYKYSKEKNINDKLTLLKRIHKKCDKWLSGHCLVFLLIDLWVVAAITHILAVWWHPIYEWP